MFAGLAFVVLLWGTAPPGLPTPLRYEAGVVSQSDGAEVVSYFVPCVQAVEIDSFSESQKAAWGDLVSRIRNLYAGADRRGRARLTLEVLKLGMATAFRDHRSVWFRYPDGAMTQATRVDYPRNGSVWRILDLPTGQYIAIVQLADSSGMIALMADYLKHPSSEDAKSAARKAAERHEGEITAFVEVNGQRQFISKGTVTPEVLGAEMAALLPNLGGEGSNRIMRSLALLEGIRSGQLRLPGDFFGADASICAAPCNADALPLPKVASGMTARATSSVSPSRLEAPSDDVTKAFFGEHGWPLPDLDLGFKEQVRKALSAGE